VKVFVRDLSKRWRTEEGDGGILIVHPLNDQVTHDLPYEDCVCGPTSELLQTGEGDAWVLTHHSLDGREGDEGPILAAMEAGERIVVLDRTTAYAGGVLGLLAVVALIWRHR
jgi:hypothetical protein